MAFHTYLMASAPYGTLYCGHSDNLAGRIYVHREKLLKGFTSQYGILRLVWYEHHETRSAAFTRERRIKKWERAWKIRLIEEMNPRWDDLYADLFL
ncbi:MAG: nuclease [Caulobacter sp.]|nr:nuclease [Caulobacter sp.]